MSEHTRLALERETHDEEHRASNINEPPADRIKDFREVEKGFNEAEAIREAGRCLRCDLEKDI